MLPDLLIRQTALRFPDSARFEVEPLEKGGSDRRYYRIRFTAGDSLILVKYGAQRDENRHYVRIAQFLGSLGISVPEIYFHDETEGLIWMQDLGEDDLWSFRGLPWSKLRPLYGKALEQLAALHRTPHDGGQKDGPVLQPAFDRDLYLWEQNYFFEHCLGHFFQVPSSEQDTRGQRDELAAIACKLGDADRVLIHRDFQSQNIMVKEGRAFLIDFQGLRFGLPAYDLASLVYDPYVSLDAAQRGQLRADYRQLQAPRADCEEFFDFCAMQRLMQALGAYGFLGLVKQKPHFLHHIPAALASLQEVVGRIAGLGRLHALLLDLPARSTVVPLP